MPLLNITPPEFPPFPRPFPTEVEELIIDILSDHPRALCNCSLACRRWFPRSRYRLLCSVSIKSRAGLASLCKLLDSHPLYRTWVCSVAVTPIVEEEALLLSGVFPTPLLSTRLPNLRRWEIIHRASRSRIPSNEQSLSFHKATLTQLQCYSSSIEELRLSALRFTSAAELVRLVGSFPCLRCLAWDDIGFDSGRDHLHEANRLLAYRRLGGLTTLDVSIGLQNAPITNFILEVVHSTLRALILRQPKDAEWTSAHPPRVNEPSLRQLGALTLHMNHNSDVAAVPFDWLPLLSEAFRTLQTFDCASTLTTFTLHIHFRSEAPGPRPRLRKPSRLSGVSRSLRFLNDGERCQRLKGVLHEHSHLHRFAISVHFPREQRRRALLLRHLREEGFFALHWVGLLGVDPGSNECVASHREPRDAGESWTVQIVRGCAGASVGSAGPPATENGDESR
ncbi:hypothetical protein BD311DRAFT_397206 [Dichomitus squalens]|uniref:F-box domain-containing protein n=1 Tax=Dichomitus squalens TaxID=114155 RepID=A0A4V2K1S8_9APHY|nr:hypothetical protein BD311DRAFT_397206 [Dichomitus squalens]